MAAAAAARVALAVPERDEVAGGFSSASAAVSRSLRLVLDEVPVRFVVPVAFSPLRSSGGKKSIRKSNISLWPAACDMSARVTVRLLLFSAIMYARSVNSEINTTRGNDALRAVLSR